MRLTGGGGCGGLSCVDLRARLLSLVAPLEPPAEVVAGVKLLDATVELGLRLRLEVDGQPVWIDVTPLERARRYAASSERFAFGYRTEGGRKPIDPALGLAICRRVAELVRGNEREVLALLREDAEDVVERDARVRRVSVESLLERMGSREAPFYALNPYVGCLIGCRFCYAQDTVATLRSLLGLRNVPWGSYVDVRQNAHEVLERELSLLEPLAIKFSPIVSDPYQAIEQRELVTRRCLEVLVSAGERWPVLLLTRSKLILRDLDLLARLPRAHVGVSLPTSDDEARRHFEPRAASVEDRLEILGALRGRGVRTIAVVQPILDGSVARLASALAPVVDSVSIDVLRGEMGAASDFDHPAYRGLRDERWQREAALELERELRARGVVVWNGELPEELARVAP
jgi:DNA repair photolyase